MAIARKRIVAAETTPYYHVIGRCVRRAFLCGLDHASGRDYEHRRQWLIDRIGELAEIFAIDILAYAVMSNHYHLVVSLKPESAHSWDECDVLNRWAALYGLPPLLQKLQDGTCSSSEHQVASKLLTLRRERLTNLSWFMKCLNEYIARKANREDHCTGSFWEGRFKSQALLDEKALISCMAYVDLNPIRAKMSTTPEASDFTSVQARINQQLSKPVRLALFRDQAEPANREDTIPFYLRDYLTLVDWTGRAYHHGKPRKIEDDLPPILLRLGFDQDQWLKSMKLYQSNYKIVGNPSRLREAAEQLSRRWFRGVTEMDVFVKS